MLQIPLQSIPSQLIKSVLAGQNFQIAIYQKTQGIFVDVNVDGVDITLSVIARDVVPIISQDYLGVSGNLIFTDTHGNKDPSYEGLGSRYVLVYLTAEEYALIR